MYMYVCVSHSCLEFRRRHQIPRTGVIGGVSSYMGAGGHLRSWSANTRSGPLSHRSDSLCSFLVIKLKMSKCLKASKALSSIE